MTNKELQSKIGKAKNPEWFTSLEVSILIHHLDVHVSKHGFAAIYDYFSRQAKGWGKLKDVAPEIGSSPNTFNQILTELDSLVINAENWDPYTLNQTWHEIYRKIDRFNENKVFTYDAPQTAFLNNIYQNKPDQYQGAYEYVTKNLNQSRLLQVNYFEGCLLAYEFQNKDSSITNRREKEKGSFTRLHNQMEELLQEDKQLLNEHWVAINKEKEELKSDYEDDLNNKKSDYENWSKETTDSHNKLLEEAKTQLEELKALYEEKLKLEAPAQHWANRAKELRKIGRIWVGSLIVVVALGVGILYYLLTAFSDDEVTKIFEKTGPALRFSVMLITLISFLAYLIRTFTKLTFSSFHLVRDAEERENLAYVYLSLLEKKAIEKEDRQLILQSLFSRADSGLLKEDSTPVMPGIDKFIQK